jgi:hydrogenase maturation protease
MLAAGSSMGQAVSQMTNMTDRVLANARIAVIGVGNAQRCDDAAGLHVARGVRARAGRDDVAVLERSGEATSLMQAWDRARAVIIVDAVRSGAAPGTVHRLDAATQSIPDSFLRCSTHSFGVADAIELGRALGQLPPCLVVYGIEGKDFDHGEDLSAEVAAAVPRVVDHILRLLTEIAGLPIP